MLNSRPLPHQKNNRMSFSNDNSYGALESQDYGSDFSPDKHTELTKFENRELSAKIEGNRKIAMSVDDFFEHGGSASNNNLYKSLRSGRQRKKTAARSKGGEFQAKRKKRRLYFCSVSDEIDVEKLADKFSTPQLGMLGKMYDEVLHLYMDKVDELAIPDTEFSRMYSVDATSPRPDAARGGDRSSLGDTEPLVDDNERAAQTDPVQTTTVEGTKKPASRRRSSFDAANNAYSEVFSSSSMAVGLDGEDVPAVIPLAAGGNVDVQSTSAFWNYGGKEVFVFDFGAIVFWGYHRSEVVGLLDLIRAHGCTAGKLSSAAEFEAGEDDMAFVTSSEVDTVTIANDVITLPDIASVKSRLAVSFAIAQSSVLSIFESRVEAKIEEYKYIPQELAAHGKVRLPAHQLANMIGEVFVIRHDVNLHSEILNIPDYFWKEHAVEPLYSMAQSYLEMAPRTEVLNKRLDLLRELLSVLQQQHENAHGVKLEWIIIWLIVTCVVLELWSIAVELIALYKGIRLDTALF